MGWLRQMRVVHLVWVFVFVFVLVSRGGGCLSLKWWWRRRRGRGKERERRERRRAVKPWKCKESFLVFLNVLLMMLSWYVFIVMGILEFNVWSGVEWSYQGLNFCDSIQLTGFGFF